MSERRGKRRRPAAEKLWIVLASEVSVVGENLRRPIREDVDRIVDIVVRFLIQPQSPAAFLEFENKLRRIPRELGRKIMEFACNRSEPEADADAPHDVVYEAGGYRRLKKTPNRYVDTTFGRITLWRRGYRYWHRDAKEPTIFPRGVMAFRCLSKGVADTDRERRRPWPSTTAGENVWERSTWVRLPKVVRGRSRMN